MSADTNIGASESPHAESMVADVKATLAEIAEPFKEKAEQLAEEQKDAGTSHIRTLATAVHCAARELWLKSLGLPAVFPPPEEQKDVKSAVEAARATEEFEPKRKH